MFGFRKLLLSSSLACSLAVTAASANVLQNPDFETMPPAVTLNNGNNITTSGSNPFAVPNWTSVSGSGALNLVRIDGPGGYSYGSNGPESDADYSGTGVVKHYIDIVNSSGGMFQTFTLPLCSSGTPDPISVNFGAFFSNRNNSAGGFPARLAIIAGPNPGGTQVGTTTGPSFPGGSSQLYPWTLRDATTTLMRGQTYTFVASMGDFANVDNVFATIDPADLCPNAVGSEAGVAEYLQARNAMILAHEPDRHRRLDKLNRSRSLSGAADDSEPLPFDLLFDGNTARFTGSSSRLDAENALGAWDFWVEGYLAGFGDDAGSGGLFGVGYVGVDYQFNQRAIVGVMLQIDHFDMDFDTPGDEINGTGWMVGPYATIKLNENLFFDIRGAWGQSDNDVEAAGATTGSFDTNRWLVSGALVGELQRGNWEIRPELQAKYISEHQDAFDNDGTTIEAQTIARGEVRFGPRVAYHHVTDEETMITPYVRADGVYSFADNGAGDLTEGSLALAAEDALHARVEAGIDLYSLSGMKFTLSGHYDGIGQQDYEIYGGMLRLGFQLD